MRKIVASLDMPISMWAKYEMSYYISMAKASGQKVLPVVIDSPGGDVYAMRSIMDMITASGLQMSTICSGKVMSAAVPIYAMAPKEKRFSFPSATFMIHEAKKFTGMEIMQKGSDLKSCGAEADRLTEDMYALLDKQCGQASGFFKGLVYEKGNSDLFLSAEKAKEYGLVSEIKIPTFADVFGDPVMGQPMNSEEMEKMIMTLAMESRQPLMEKRKEFLALAEAKNEDALNLSIAAFFNNNSNFKSKEDLDCMNKEKYESIARKYLESGITCMSYEVFAKVDTIAQTSYLNGLEATYESIAASENKYPVDKKPVDLDISALIDAKVKDLSENIENKVRLEYATKLEAQQRQLDSLAVKDAERTKSYEKQLDVSFVESLIKDSKIPPSMRNKTLELLANQDTTTKITFTVGSESIKGTPKDQTKAWLNAFEKSEHYEADVELADVEGEIVTVTKEDQDIDFTSTKAEIALQKQTDIKVRAYAVANGIDIDKGSKAFENYRHCLQMVLNK
jgi:ATP-dependent protease ClpP protease subunit